MDEREKLLIEQMSMNLAQLLRGKKVKPIRHEDYPKSLEILAKYINEVVYSFAEIWDFILPLSQGVLSVESPKASNILASPFKELHSQLRTLVWQVQQIAAGDYKQRVDFMGEFSDAFNSMVETLEEKNRLLNENIAFLENEAKRLRESEARYASAVKNSPGGIFIFDPKTMKVVESNEQFNRMMGYCTKEISELKVCDFYANKLIAEEDIKNILGKSLTSMANRQFCLKNDKFVDVDINSCWSENGQSNVVIVSILDVTERNKAQEISAKYKALLENARDMILFVSIDGQILEANKAAQDVYGYSHDELILLNIYHLRNAKERLEFEGHKQELSFNSIVYETTHIRKDGTSFPVEVSSQGILVGNEKILTKVIRDISDRKRIEDNLRYFASHDALTKVPNRHVLEETYNQIAVQSPKNNETGALLLIDVDNFKFINDTFGHTVGDMVLVNMVSVLKQNLREEDLLARLGGDEFVVLLNKVTKEEAHIVAEKLRCAIEKEKLYPDNCEITFGYTISIGVASIYNESIEFRDIISHADYALYQAKDRGRNCIYYVSNEKFSIDKLSETNDLMIIINNALEKDKIVLFFQPIVDILSGKTTHHEALMRIVMENGKIIYPDKIIPIAERFGLMSKIDMCIVKLSFDALEKYPEIKLFVNLSGDSIGNDELLSFIEENIQKRGINPSRIGFEITETMAVKDLVRADKWIKRLRQWGCEFALDDFGIGFSSFSYLQYLSVDYIKIDGSYVRDIDKNSKNRALVQAINTVARSLGKEVIAEFVENSSIFDILAEDQVSYAQGYYLGRPEAIPKNWEKTI